MTGVCDCGHPWHVHGGPNGCSTVSVTGPASDHPAREGDHGTRTTTPCPCTRTTTTRTNGHPPDQPIT